ncbi:DUF899 family protein [Pseudaminobacter sp. NGMCC 1.201702]|uniref:DUF899 family protein n=1 Tax=Pseudaminobacter sp. NGMCC 1.201702 TaxID=3391825 RepID=UPI0039F02361
MGVTFRGESAEYRVARDKLLQSEIALRRQMEAVAAERRALPPGPLVEKDYQFERIGADGKPQKMKLSDLFAPGTTSLLIYNMMFPRHSLDDRPQPSSGPFANLPREETPCPSCTGLLDQLNGAAHHFRAAGFNFAVVTQTFVKRTQAFADQRGWTNLVMLSAVGATFKHDFNALFEDGQLAPMTHVFQNTPEGIRHFWSSEMMFAGSDPGQDPRQQGTIEPLWNMMDLMPEGRPDFDEQVEYSQQKCCE